MGQETAALINDSSGILFFLAGNAALWFFLEKKTGWKLFQFLPPLIFIYFIPAGFSNTGIIPIESPTYSWMGTYLLPVFLVLLLLDVDVRGTVRVMGKGVFVMLMGTLGVVVGAPVGYMAIKGFIQPDMPNAWKGFGALAGSWIGGTGNMAAVAEGLFEQGEDTSPFGLAVIADNVVYLIWLPILLQSKNLAKWFHKFTGVSEGRLNKMKEAADSLVVDKGTPKMRHYMYLVALGLLATWVAILIANHIPPLPPVLNASTYKILLVTTFGIALSFSPAKNIPGSHELAMMLVYLFVGRMGATADLSGIGGALPFVSGAYIWIFIHGAFLLLAARIFRVDVHTAAIASAANIGGAASAPIVASYHDERLVPVAVLMALIGYAIGNYAAFAAAYLCSVVAGV